MTTKEFQTRGTLSIFFHYFKPTGGCSPWT